MFVFHIGLYKTGTSTLQALMAANREALKARGIIYPAIDSKRHNAHHQLQLSLRSDKGIDAAAWEALRELRPEARDKTVLISSEGFSVVDPRLVREGIEDNDARIIVYVRNPHARVVSGYSQRAKKGKLELSFDEALTDHLGCFAECILPWAEVFGLDRVRVRSVEPECLVNGQIVDDFLSALGTTREGLVIPANANETPDWRVVELLKEKHVLTSAKFGKGNKEAGALARQIYEAGVSAGARLGWRDRGDYLTREQKRLLAEIYRSGRQRLLDALPDARIADIAFDLDRDRPFMPSPEAVSAEDRRAFEEAFAEAMTEMAAAKPAKREGPLFSSLRRIARRFGA